MDERIYYFKVDFNASFVSFFQSDMQDGSFMKITFNDDEEDDYDNNGKGEPQGEPQGDPEKPPTEHTSSVRNDSSLLDASFLAQLRCKKCGFLVKTKTIACHMKQNPKYSAYMMSDLWMICLI